MYLKYQVAYRTQNDHKLKEDETQETQIPLWHTFTPISLEENKRQSFPYKYFIISINYCV